MSEPIYDIDTIRVSAYVPLDIYMKLKKRAAERNKSLSHYIGVVLYAETQHDQWTLEDEEERKKLMQENLRKRQAIKAKKRGSK
ncbi:MAG: hypothetical protein J6V72_19875 [Kiritimatiellae bacterium]|nr:hypothetical protein [Kiritimatiellia bacterium]